MRGRSLRLCCCNHSSSSSSSSSSSIMTHSSPPFAAAKQESFSASTRRNQHNHDDAKQEQMANSAIAAADSPRHQISLRPVSCTFWNAFSQFSFHRSFASCSHLFASIILNTLLFGKIFNFQAMGKETLARPP